MKQVYRLLSIALLLALTACGAIIKLDGLSIEVPQRATNQPLPATTTALPSTATQTASPTVTVSPSPTASPTVISVPTVTTLVNLNIRSGASIYSSTLTKPIPANTTIQLFGRSADSAWLGVRYVDSAGNVWNGWVSSADNLVRINGASLGSLPIVSVIPPITITPTIDPTPTQERPKQRVSYNINGEAIPDRAYLKAHLIRLCPTTVLVMNGMAYAVELYQALRSCGTLVAHRTYSYYEGDEWVIRSPQQIVNAWIAEGHPEIIRYAVNEPSYGGTHSIQSFVQSQVDLMRLARDAGFTVIVANFSVGRFYMEEMSAGYYDALLRGVELYRQYLGVHEYTQPVLPFGVSQWPREYALDRNRVQPANWPSFAQIPLAMQFDPVIHNLNYPRYYHLRRADWFLLRADAIGVSRPQIWVTEWGWDSLSDVKQSLESLRSPFCVLSGKYLCDLRGINTYENLWGWYYPQWTFAQATCEQIKWGLSIYPPEYIGFNLFTWGVNPMWLQTDFSGRENADMYQLHTCLENL